MSDTRDRTFHAGPHPSRRRKTLLSFLLLLFAALLVAHLMTGSVYISPRSIMKILLGNIASENPGHVTIIRDLRLFRALTAGLAGMALACAGLQMQTLFGNPLADPFVLGINSGASLGVAFVVLASGFLPITDRIVFNSPPTLIAAASIGAGVMLLLVLAVSRLIDSNVVLLILGLLFGYAAGSIVNILMYFTEHYRLRSFTFWSFGSYVGLDAEHLAYYAGVTFAGILLAMLIAKSLNAFLLGQTYAQTMGVSVKAVRISVLLGASILAGATTAFCGPIAFLGIAVPHLARGLLGTADHRVLIPGVVLLGGSMSLAADIAAKLPGTDYTLPLNSVMALIGAPVVAWVVLKKQKRVSIG